MNNNYYIQLIQKNILRQLDERKIPVQSIDNNEPDKTVLLIDNGFITIEELEYNDYVFNLTYQTKNNPPEYYDEIISISSTSYTLLINLLERELITNQIFKDKAVTSHVSHETI